MTTVVFVAPFFAEATVRFISAAAALDGTRLAVVSQDPLERLPLPLRRRLAAHERIADALDPGQIAAAVRETSRRIGACQRLIGALEQLQVPLALVRQELGLPGMLPEAAQNFRDKSRMKQRFAEAGVGCARHAVVTALDPAREFAARVGFPIVVKPPAGAGARDTFRVQSPQELERGLAGLRPSAEQPVLIEEFVVGEEHSFDTVSIRGTHVWHSLTHYRPGPLEVMRQPWVQWTVLLPREIDHPRYDAIRELAGRALDALGVGTALTHMEWFSRPDGSLAISEVAARPPGAQFTTLISWAHDTDFYRAWARLMVEERFDPPPRRFAAGIAYLRGQGSGVVRAVQGLDRAQRELGHLVAESRLPRLGQPAASGYEGEGYVVLRHPETAVVARALARLVELVRVELG